MALIQSAITKREFEKVRDRIGEILATELPNQATLNSLSYLDAKVGIERMIPLHPSDLINSFINVRIANGSFNNYKLLDKDGNYTFFVDCYMQGYSTDDDRGDKLAQMKLQRLTGVVDAIISDTKYITLGWAKPSISRVQVTEIEVQDYSQFKNESNAVMSRVVVEVRVPESVEQFNPPPIDAWTTQAFLELTDSGYIFSGQSPVIPPPPDCDPATYQNTDGSFVQNINSGATYTAPDIILTINGLGFLSVVANSDQNIVLKNTQGDIINPENISGNEIFIEIGSGSDMVVDFTVDNTTPDENQTVQFTTQITGETATQWFWDFGDGQTSTLENPTHIYISSGQYTVSLLAGNIDNKGGFIEKINFIDVISLIKTPDQIFGNNLITWINTNRSTTIKDGFNNVSQINDITPNNYHLIAPNISSEPLLVENELNGKPILRFDGISEYLETIAPISAYKFLNDGSTDNFIVLILNIQNVNPDAVFVLLSTTSITTADRGYTIRLEDRTSQGADFRIENDVTVGSAGLKAVENRTSNNYITPFNWEILGVINKPNEVDPAERSEIFSNFLNQTKNNTRTTAFSNSNPSDILKIGINTLQNIRAQMDLAEILICNISPNQQQLTDLQNYIQHEWNL